MYLFCVQVNHTRFIMKFSKFLIGIDFIIGIFYMYMFIYNANHRPMYGLLMFISLIMIGLHIHMFILNRKQNKNTIIDLNGIILGLLVFLNPNLGAIIASINYIMISILKLFRFS